MGLKQLGVGAVGLVLGCLLNGLNVLLVRTVLWG